jgi:hydrogenase 3 maturation protease
VFYIFLRTQVLLPDGPEIKLNIILGIGNTMRGDDGAGPYLARTFHQVGWIALDCGTMPENFSSVLRREEPEMVVLVDAADMGLSIGEFRRVPLTRIADLSIGTHAASLTAFIQYIGSFVNEVVFIGIQPGEIHDGPSLTRPVRKGVEHLKEVLKKEGISGVLALFPE